MKLAQHNQRQVARREKVGPALQRAPLPPPPLRQRASPQQFSPVLEGVGRAKRTALSDSGGSGSGVGSGGGGGSGAGSSGGGSPTGRAAVAAPLAKRSRIERGDAGMQPTAAYMKGAEWQVHL